MQQEMTSGTTVVSPLALLEHWQAHRRLTRRVIQAFPEDKLFSYSIGGMRPFFGMVMELISLADAGINGVVTGKWTKIDETAAGVKPVPPATKDELLQLWDRLTGQINEYWPRITPQRFQEVAVAYGKYESPIYALIFYWIDNENHHRGEGYVYLRSLGIEPPPFYDRS